MHAYARATIPRFNTSSTHNLSRAHSTHIKDRRSYRHSRIVRLSKYISSHRRTVSYIAFTPPFELFRILTLAPSIPFGMTHTSPAQLSHSFSRIRYSLADNLAELVNLVEENLVVRHSSDEEVEEVDRTRRLHAPKGASKLCEFVIIRKACRCASLSPLVAWVDGAVVFRVVPCGIRGGVNVAAYRGFTAAFVLPPSLLPLSLSSHRQQRIRFPLRARYAHTHRYMYTAVDNTPVLARPIVVALALDQYTRVRNRIAELY